MNSPSPPTPLGRVSSTRRQQVLMIAAGVVLIAGSFLFSAAHHHPTRHVLGLILQIAGLAGLALGALLRIRQRRRLDSR